MSPLGVLIVEDEMLVAIEVKWALEEAGHRVVGVAMDAKTAFAYAAEHPVDVALCDVNLRDGATGPEIALRLAREYGVTCVFLTGNPEQIPPGYAAAIGVLPKPCAAPAVLEVVDLARRFRAGEAVSGGPARFLVADWLAGAVATEHH